MGPEWVWSRPVVLRRDECGGRPVRGPQVCLGPGVALPSLSFQGVNKMELKEYNFWNTIGLGCKPYSAVYQLCRFGQKT